jgi:hypothetical protein
MADFILPADIDDSECRVIAEVLAQTWHYHMTASGVPSPFSANVVRDTIRNARQHHVAQSCARAAESDRRKKKTARPVTRLEVVG